MAILRHGTTRTVVVTKRFAFKFAKNKRGVKCNLFEADLYRVTSPARKAMLAPVLWCSWFGVLVVARSATPISQDEAKRLRETDGFPDWDYVPPNDGCPFEYKAADWGRIDGRLVAVDYSATVRTPKELLEEAAARNRR